MYIFVYDTPPGAECDLQVYFSAEENIQEIEVSYLILWLPVSFSLLSLSTSLAVEMEELISTVVWRLLSRIGTED